MKHLQFDYNSRDSIPDFEEAYNIKFPPNILNKYGKEHIYKTMDLWLDEYSQKTFPAIPVIGKYLSLLLSVDEINFFFKNTDYEDYKNSCFEYLDSRFGEYFYNEKPYFVAPEGFFKEAQQIRESLQATKETSSAGTNRRHRR